MKPKPFERLLEEATPGNWIDNGNEIVSENSLMVGIAGAVSDGDNAYIARLSPDTMKEVWEALKGAVTRLSVLVETGQATLPEEQTYKQCKHAIALLNGEKP